MQNLTKQLKNVFENVYVIVVDVSIFFRQETLLANISEKDTKIAALELQGSSKSKRNEIKEMKSDKEKLVTELKDQVCLLTQVCKGFRCCITTRLHESSLSCTLIIHKHYVSFLPHSVISRSAFSIES